MTMEMGHARVMPDEHEMFDMSRRRSMVSSRVESEAS